MRILKSFTITMFLALPAFAQSSSISAEEYDRVIRYALTETNQRYPFVHTFTSQIYQDGSPISDSVHIAERQASGVERQTFTAMESGKKTVSYQLRTGYGNNVYCSSNGKSWTGPQVYECPRSIRVYRPDTPSSTEYSVEEKNVNGKSLKAYRKFEVFGTDPTTQTFSKDIALIGSDGLFTSTIQTMGTLKNKVIDTKLTNSWKLNAKFIPIEVPKNLTPPSEKKEKLTIIKN